jgi:hypothetical protein
MATAVNAGRVQFHEEHKLTSPNRCFGMFSPNYMARSFLQGPSQATSECTEFRSRLEFMGMQLISWILL